MASAGRTACVHAAAAAAAGAPVVAVAGRTTLAPEVLTAHGIRAVYPFTALEPDLALCIAGAGALLGALPVCARAGLPAARNERVIPTATTPIARSSRRCSAVSVLPRNCCRPSPWREQLLLPSRIVECVRQHGHVALGVESVPTEGHLGEERIGEVGEPRRRSSASAVPRRPCGRRIPARSSTSDAVARDTPARAATSSSVTLVPTP